MTKFFEVSDIGAKKFAHHNLFSRSKRDHCGYPSWCTFNTTLDTLVCSNRLLILKEMFVDVLITVRNVVAARLCFHRRLSFCSQGGCIPACTWADTPRPATATSTDGTHPTGMHSCFICIFRQQWQIRVTVSRRLLIPVSTLFNFLSAMSSCPFLFTRGSILHILLDVSATQCSITLFFYLWCCFEGSGS